MPNFRLPRTLQSTDSGRGRAIGTERAGTLACERLGDLKRARIAAQRRAANSEPLAGFREKLLTAVVAQRRTSVKDFLAAQAYRERQARAAAAPGR